MSVWLTASIVEGAQSVEKNESAVTVILYANWDWGSYNHTNPRGALTVDGQTFNFNSNFNDNRTNAGSQEIYRATKTVKHDPDGSKTVQCSSWYETQVSSGTVEWAGSLRLSTIPRATLPKLSAANIEMGQTLTIQTVPEVSGFTHRLTYDFLGRTGVITEKTAKTSHAWKVPLNFANELPASVSGKCVIKCETYSGAKLIGTKSVGFTATVPASVRPIIDGVTVAEAVQAVADKVGAYTQGKSKLHVTTQARGAYLSTVQSIAVVVDGKTYTGDDVTTELLAAFGDLPLTVTVKDSRGRTQTVARMVKVLEYFDPRLDSFAFGRADASGNWDEEGERVRLDLGYAIAPVGNKNANTWKLEYRERGAEQWKTALSGTGYGFTGTKITGADISFSVDSAYELKLTLSDSFSSTTAPGEIQTAYTLMDFRKTGHGIAFGKVSEKDAFECALDFILTGDFQQEAKRRATLQNGWVDYSPTYYEGATFWKDAMGVVHLSGMIKDGAIIAGTTIFTLPQGYRPENQELFLVVSANNPCRVDVARNGNVYIQAGASKAWLSLAGISFRAV